MIAVIVVVFYFVLFMLGFAFGKMDKKSEEPQKPLEVHYTRHDVKRWTACKRIGAGEFMNVNQDTLDNIMVEDFTRQFKGIIKDHMTIERDLARYEVIYRVEMWID